MTTFNANDKNMLTAIGVLLAAALAYGANDGGVMLPMLLGGAIFAAAAVTALAGQGAALSRVALPVLGMCMVGLLIHVARGRPEAHFAVFAFLACTVVYRHWMPVVAAAATIAVHHLSFNLFQQWGWGPISFTEPGFMRVVEHGAYVVAESVLLVLLTKRTRADFAASEELTGLVAQLVSADGTVDFTTTHGRVNTPAARQLQQALHRVESTISAVRSSAESITTATAEIASGNLDLSQRTENAASSLQQTASSMEQLNTTVRHSAESAVQAKDLAASAAQVAQRGGSVVSQVVATMSDINGSSKKISDIIGTIDGIAFQTNILALNAAVEAARAGEQGRGFAVVASEVRSLAQRSAEAAREIKALIGTSVDKVEAGTRLVADAGDTMSEIVASVQRVADIIGEISTASGEQSAGIGQVNQAVNELDQSTQQNAALVEESAAAAGSLKEQALRLVELVATFQVSGENSRPAGAAHAAIARAGASASVNAGPAPQQPAAKAAPKAAAPKLIPKLNPKAAPTVAAKAASKPAAPAPAAAGSDDWETF
ncbi:MAG: chemotaxis protein [Leptothrix sp. (in: Bacteria)]|nr:chemotaxis protein [Leptothrix sp. (in: b-proteobacteria)]